jgi:hypothetical protein
LIPVPEAEASKPLMKKSNGLPLSQYWACVPWAGRAESWLGVASTDLMTMSCRERQASFLFPLLDFDDHLATKVENKRKIWCELAWTLTAWPHI